MDYYYNILITGCSSGLGEALFNKVWEHDFLKPFGHYRTEDGDPYALIGDITDPDFPEKLDNYIREREIDCFINNACLLYTSPSPRDKRQSRMPSSA